MINGRFTYGFYKKMDLDYLVCNNKDEYVNLAIKLGNDKIYRKEKEELIRERNHLLFSEKESIETWDEKITELVNQL